MFVPLIFVFKVDIIIVVVTEVALPKPKPLVLVDQRENTLVEESGAYAEIVTDSPALYSPLPEP